MSRLLTVPTIEHQPITKLDLHFGDSHSPNQWTGDPVSWKEEKPRMMALPKSPRYLALMGKLTMLETECVEIREELQRIVIREACDTLEGLKEEVA